MGYTAISMLVTANLSAHNSQQDDDDQALWDDLASRVRALADEAKYKPICAMVI